ncbi:PAS domain S-box protein [Methanosarcina sp. Z-7115]|uniref:PAS domain S-box protein n=1 Tax=Methanosarcina baikalica TaxID=3073890 RepID=A0ABU2D0M5_9EURY|nr:PAS domain S-box protein [Methanosarcina sp. Z-7115]MDR7665513.1 PAS domain S-box protein [Methanosarcina sp. Z-7115]
MKSHENSEQRGKYRQEFRFRKKDGTHFYAEDRGVRLLDKDGKPYKLLGVIKDITERELAHERVQKSEERYRSSIENFKGIVFQADKYFIPQFVDQLEGKMELNKDKGTEFTIKISVAAKLENFYCFPQLSFLQLKVSALFIFQLAFTKKNL